MKKLIAIVAVAVIAVSAATAQVIIGAKGIFSVGVGTTLEGSIARVFDEYKKSGADVGQKVALGAGGGVYIRYNLPMLVTLGFQTELDLLAYNGLEVRKDSIGRVFSYPSLELPVLVTYDLSMGPVTLTTLVGPHLSFPLASAKMELVQDGAVVPKSAEAIPIANKVLFGISFGVAVGVPVGSGSIVGDVRYLNDFSKVISSYMGTTDDCVTRRSLNISLGYQTYF